MAQFGSFQGGFGLGELLQRGQNRGFNFGGLGSSAGSALLGSGGNPLLAAGLTFGPPLLNAFGSLIGGASRSQKANRGLFDEFTQESQGTPDFLNQNQVFGDLQAAQRPQLQAQAQSLSNRLGISSPLAQAGIAQNNISTSAGIRAQLAQLFARLQVQNKGNIRTARLRAAQGV